MAKISSNKSHSSRVRSPKSANDRSAESQKKARTRTKPPSRKKNESAASNKQATKAGDGAQRTQRNDESNAHAALVATVGSGTGIAESIAGTTAAGSGPQLQATVGELGNGLHEAGQQLASVTSNVLQSASQSWDALTKGFRLAPAEPKLESDGTKNIQSEMGPKEMIERILPNSLFSEETEAAPAEPAPYENEELRKKALKWKRNHFQWMSKKLLQKQGKSKREAAEETSRWMSQFSENALLKSADLESSFQKSFEDLSGRLAWEQVHPDALEKWKGVLRSNAMKMGLSGEPLEKQVETWLTELEDFVIGSGGKLRSTHLNALATIISDGYLNYSNFTPVYLDNGVPLAVKKNRLKTGAPRTNSITPIFFRRATGNGPTLLGWIEGSTRKGVFGWTNRNGPVIRTPKNKPTFPSTFWPFPSDSESALDRKVENILQATELGQSILAFKKKFNIATVFSTHTGSNDNREIAGIAARDYGTVVLNRIHSPFKMAATTVHEIGHYMREATEVSLGLGYDEFMARQLHNEAYADALASEFQRQWFAASGFSNEQVPDRRARAYIEGYEAAVVNYWKAHPRGTQEEASKAGWNGGLLSLIPLASASRVWLKFYSSDWAKRSTYPPPDELTEAQILDLVRNELALTDFKHLFDGLGRMGVDIRHRGMGGPGLFANDGTVHLQMTNSTDRMSLAGLMNSAVMYGAQAQAMKESAHAVDLPDDAFRKEVERIKREGVVAAIEFASQYLNRSFMSHYHYQEFGEGLEPPLVRDYEKFYDTAARMYWEAFPRSSAKQMHEAAKTKARKELDEALENGTLQLPNDPSLNILVEPEELSKYRDIWKVLASSPAVGSIRTNSDRNDEDPSVLTRLDHKFRDFAQWLRGGAV